MDLARLLLDFTLRAVLPAAIILMMLGPIVQALPLAPELKEKWALWSGRLRRFVVTVLFGFAAFAVLALVAQAAWIRLTRA